MVMDIRVAACMVGFCQKKTLTEFQLLHVAAYFLGGRRGVDYRVIIRIYTHDYDQCIQRLYSGIRFIPSILSIYLNYEYVYASLFHYHLPIQTPF